MQDDEDPNALGVDPDNFDALMDALPWSLRERVLKALRGDEDADSDPEYSEETQRLERQLQSTLRFYGRKA